MHRSLSSTGARRLVVAVIAVAAFVPTPGSRAEQATAWQDVSFRGVHLRVPASWPVYDLAAEPNRCARSDANAVYIGRQGPDALCPAQIIGAAEAVYLEPLADREQLRGFQPSSIDGEEARVDPRGRVSGRIATGFERLRALVTVTFGTDHPLAEQIARSIRVQGSGPTQPSGASAPSGAATPAPSLPPATPSALPPTQVASHPAPLQPGIFFGDGFDTCANPALEKMQAWLSSPYRAIGIYIGGINHGCKAQTLTAGWVADAARMGWSFIPIYVGLQAPCQASTRTVKIDPAQAAAQGRAAADDAIARADLFRLPTGSPLYYDIEGYSGTAACDQAVRSFLDAWTRRVQERRYVSGVYSSEASGIDNLAEDYNNPAFARPDVIWTAHWGEPKRIFGHNQTWLPDSMWTNHQRIHQYTGGHVETWGGQSINIDGDLLDAPVVRFAAAQRWTIGDIDAADGNDLVHLCCGDYLNTWFTKGDGNYDVKSYRPGPGYNLQLGSWATADLGEDARADLLHFCCADYLHSWISQGDGTYSVGTFRPWPGYGLHAGRWGSADLNGDGSTDLVHFCCRDYVHTWISQGDGTFTVGTYSRPGYGIGLGSWLPSDVNGDGKGDFVHFCCRDYVHTWISQGDGTFTVGTYSRPGYGIGLGSWLPSDVNGDGKGDFVHLCCPDYIHTWISQGDGTFTVGTYSRPGYGIGLGSWLPSDVNGDGKGDFVHLCCPDYIHTWISQGDGTFTVGTYSRPGYGIGLGSWLPADMDGDGDGDLVHLCCPTYFHTWFSEADGTYRVTASPL